MIIATGLAATLIADALSALGAFSDRADPLRGIALALAGRTT
jgi:hypothetical protein